jgi:hypothetical protein
VKALQQLGLSQREACKSGRARRRSSRESPSTKAQCGALLALRLPQVAQTHAEHSCRRLYNDYERDATDSDEYMNYSDFVGFIGLLACRWAVVVGVVVRSLFVGVAYVALHDRSKGGRSISFTTVCSMGARFAA